MRITQLIVCLLASVVTEYSIADKPLEITLAAGMGTANDPAVKEADGRYVQIDSGSAHQVIFNVEQGRNTEGDTLYYEFLYSSSTMSVAAFDRANRVHEFDLQASYLHLGGHYEWNTSSRMAPYFTMTFGMAHYEPKNSKPYSDSDTFLSGSAGFGAKFRATNQIALRAEARAYGTLLESTTRLFCENESCDFEVEGELWTQYQMTAGVTFKF